LELCPLAAPKSSADRRVVLPVHLARHPASRGAEEFNAVITITCLVGDRIPVGAEESVEFGIPGVIDFDAR